MKLLQALIMALSISVSAISIAADSPASRKSVEQLMGLMDLAKMVDAMYAQTEHMFKGLASQMGVSEKERPYVDKYMKKVGALLKQEASWDKYKEPMIAVYVKHFTEQEVQALITFYSSPAGKSMLKKMPIIMRDSMLVAQGMMKQIMPKVQKLATEMQAEITKSRQGVTKPK